MQLLSCKHPVKVYNKYSDEFVWVPCGKCTICKNRRSAHYTELLEREKKQHKYAFFVTLTYDDLNLPILHPNFLGESPDSRLFRMRDVIFVSNRFHDDFCIPFESLFDMSLYRDKFHFSDIRFVYDLVKTTQFFGIPYASKTDIQLFLKRLNKYAHDKITNQFKNFRYFITSEYGSTTFRPHFHAIFYVDSDRFAERFKEAVSACWQYGISDCQHVENKACGYVAQYLNKSADLPYVYQNKPLSPFFLCSRNPFIGAYSECPQDDAELVNISACTTCVPEDSSGVRVKVVPLQQSYQNRLYPKCPCFSQVSDYVRTEFYSISQRFTAKTLKGFLSQVYDYLSDDVSCNGEFAEYLRSRLTFSSRGRMVIRACFDKHTANQQTY